MTSMAERISEIPFVHELRSQLATTPRLRWLLFSVLLIVLVYVALVLDDERIQVADDYRRIAEKAFKLESLEVIEQADFESFYEREMAANAALRGRMWMASSRGLAGAEFQSWLRRIASENKMVKVRLDLSEIRPVPGLETPLWRLEAELSGELTPSDARSLIAAFARSQRTVNVERLSYLPRRGDRMTVQLAAHFIIENGSGGAEQ